MSHDGKKAKPNDPGDKPRVLVAGQRVFDRYYLKRTLGLGGMGVVWLAHDRILEQPIALKFLAEELFHDHNEIKRLKHETRRNLKLSHPNIVRIHDFEQDMYGAAIAMEYVDGWSLWAMKVDQPRQIFDVSQLGPWIHDLCEALEYAHNDARIVHRDLKPANLLLNSRGQLKVTDFGLSREIRGTGEPDPAHPRIVGTDLYMSPQQWTGEPPAVADDVYSIGVTIYELLTGNPPFYEGDVFKQLFEMTPPSMTERLHALGIDDVVIPLVWEETVAACLAKEADRRPVSAREVAVKLGLIESPKSLLEKPLAATPEVGVSPLDGSSVGPPEGGTSDQASQQTLAPALPEAGAPETGVNAPEDGAVMGYAPGRSGMGALIFERARGIASLVSSRVGNRRSVRIVAAAIGVLLVVSIVWLGGRHLAEPRSGSTGAKAPSAPLPLGESWQNSLGMKFVSVPATPILFSIWETRVQDFETFVRETGYDAGTDIFLLSRAGQWKRSGHSWRNPDFPQTTNSPVVGVTWRDAERFCEWLTARERKRGVLAPNQSYRLPRVTEWIHAAGTALYPWSDDWPPPPGTGNFAGTELHGSVTNHPIIAAYNDGFAGTAPVGSFKPNALGIFDLGGNAWEFCADGPVGAPNARWMMGGSWENFSQEALSVSNRARGDGQNRYSHRGFRCVLVLEGRATNAAAL